MSNTDPEPEVKNCFRCKQEKPVDEFSWVTARGKQRRHSWCRDCRNSYGNTHYHAHAEQRREQAKARYWADPEAARAKARLRPKSRDWPGRLRRYGLTTAEYDAMVATQGGVCALCR